MGLAFAFAVRALPAGGCLPAPDFFFAVDCFAVPTGARYVAGRQFASASRRAIDTCTEPFRIDATDASAKTCGVPKLRVQFAHGLESSPFGNKARLFAQHFDALTPAMDTRDLEQCVRVHAAALEQFAPHLLIGSSFGGAVAVTLLERGLWRGPTLLLAQAARLYAPSCRLPAGVRVSLVHAVEDEVVNVEGSRALAKTGTPELVELIEVHDDHGLTALTANGELVRLVKHAAGRV